MNLISFIEQNALFSAITFLVLSLFWFGVYWVFIKKKLREEKDK